MADKSITATLLNGAIRSTEQEEMARLLRRKSQFLIAYGSCAVSGGIPGLANQFPREQILQFNYEQAPTLVNDGKTRPQLKFAEATAAKSPCRRSTTSCARWTRWSRWIITFRAVRRRPRSPRPPSRRCWKASCRPKAPCWRPTSPCATNARAKSPSPELSFTEFKRPHQLLADPELCFLAQGVVCMGPATRSGCGAQCTTGNMPCTGCFGPTSRVRDQGLKIMSSVCANVAPKEEGDINKVLAGIPDPIGTFYRYGLAKSLLRRKVNLPGQWKVI